jgi:hypothetical protein
VHFLLVNWWIRKEEEGGGDVIADWGCKIDGRTRMIWLGRVRVNFDNFDNNEDEDDVRTRRWWGIPSYNNQNSK